MPTLAGPTEHHDARHDGDQKGDQARNEARIGARGRHVQAAVVDEEGVTQAQTLARARQRREDGEVDEEDEGDGTIGS